MSRALTATIQITAAAMLVTGVLAVSPVRAVPVVAAPADENPAAPRIALDIPPFETVGDAAPKNAAPRDGEAVMADQSFAAPAGAEVGSLPSAQHPHEVLAEAGLAAVTAWSPKDFPGDDPAGHASNQLFAVPLHEILALPDHDRIDAVPEPGLLVLVSSGLIGVALLSRRRNCFPHNEPHRGDPA